MSTKFCPCCKRRMPAPKQTKIGKDLGRANSAIQVLERVIADPNEDKILRAACKDELLRMKRAAENPDLLWAIYRRNDKGGYDLPAQRKTA